ncbi:S1 RNA-binding domain-containing protein, partial [uncultured Methylobacterium sp.]
TIDRLIAHHLADRVGATFAGQVSGVTRSGLFIKLDETGADGFVPISTLGAEYFRHEEGRHALVGERTRQTFRLGDKVEVQLMEAAPVAGALRFAIAGGDRAGAPAPARGGPRKGRPAPERRESLTKRRGRRA